MLLDVHCLIRFSCFFSGAIPLQLGCKNPIPHQLLAVVFSLQRLTTHNDRTPLGRAVSAWEREREREREEKNNTTVSIPANKQLNDILELPL
jgi:hypothetical protein